MTQSYRDSIRTNPPNPGAVDSINPGRFTAEFSFSAGSPPEAVDFYEIYRQDDGTSRVLGNPSCCSRVLIATLSASAPLTYTDTGLNPNTTYVYEIGCLLSASGDFPLQRSNQVEIFDIVTDVLPERTVDVRETTTTTISLVWLTTGVDSLAFFISFKAAPDQQSTARTLTVEEDILFAEYILDSLIPGELYSIRVQSGDNALNDEITQRTLSIVDDNFVVLDFNSTAISVAWRAADTPIIVDINPEDDDRRNVNVGDRPVHTFTGLNPSTVYTITRLNQFETSIRTSPASPTNLSVSTTPTSFVVEWTAAASEVSRYKVEVRCADMTCSYSSVVFPNEELVYELTQLFPLREYLVTVSSCLDANGQFEEQAGDEPLEQSIITRDEVLTFIMINSFGIAVSWNNAPDSSNYYLQYDPSDGTPLSPITTSQESQFILELTPGQIYNFALSSGTPETGLASLARATYVLAPLAPSIEINSLSPTTILISILPASSGVLEYYRVDVSARQTGLGIGQDGEGSFNIASEACPEVFIIDLVPGGTYDIGVVAVSGERDSPVVAMDVSQGTMAAGQLYLNDRTRSSIEVVWGAVTDTTFTNYAVYLFLGSNRIQTHQRAPDDERKVLLENLLAGTEYSVTLLLEGDLTSQSSLTTATAPLAPGSLTFLSVEGQQVTLGWPSSNSRVDYYELCWTPFNQTRVLSSDTTQHTLTLDQSDVEYTISLYAVLSVGLGDESHTIRSEAVTRFITLGERLEGELNVNDFTTTSITVEWSEVVSINFQNYRLQATPEGGVSATSDVISPQDARTFTFNSLVPGVLYTINNILEGTDPAVTRTVRQRTTPSPPSSLVVSSLNADDTIGFQLSWVLPSEGEWDRIRITYTPTNGVSQMELVGRTDTSFTLQGLLQNTNYLVEVTSVSGLDNKTEESTPVTRSVVIPSCSAGTVMTEYGSVAMFENGAINSRANSTNTPCPFYTERGGLPIEALCEGDYQSPSNWVIPQMNCGRNLTGQEILGNLKKVGVTEENAANVAEGLAAITAMGQDISQDDLSVAVDLLELITRINSADIQVTRSIVEIADNIAALSDEQLEDAEERDSVPSRVVLSLESQLAIVEVENGSSTRFVETNVAAEVLDVSAEDINQGYTVYMSATDNGESISDEDFQVKEGDLTQEPEAIESQATLFLPSGLADSFSKRRGRLVITTFRVPSLFQDKGIAEFNQNAVGFNRTVNSRIISASVNNEKVEDLREPVGISFVPLNPNGTNASCVFWDFDEKAWSQLGCIKKSNDSTDRIECECNHLTNFGILMDIYGGDALTVQEDFILEIISYIGCCMSIWGLLLTIFTYATNKKLRGRKPNQILLSLCSSLLGLYVVFLVMISLDTKRNVAELPLVPCSVLAAFLHYFVLASLFWMGVEGYNMYNLFVRVLNTYLPWFMRKASLVAWGVPLLIVGVTVGASRRYYAQTDFCFLTFWPLIGGLLIPVGVVMIFNFSMYVRVLKGLNKTVKGKQLSKTEKRQRLRRFQNALCILILMGLTWSFGYLSIIQPASAVVQVVFTVLNSLQGYFIFMFYCLRQPQVRRLWRSQFSCCLPKSFKTPSASNSSSGQTNSTFKNSSGRQVANRNRNARLLSNSDSSGFRPDTVTRSPPERVPRPLYNNGFSE